tara:strand:+ start:934 stop:2001 length:1068 start_codon:yes stop_codon:yes gene_type:complete
MLIENIKKLIPGIILALIFSLICQLINITISIKIFGTTKSPISTVLIAILLGIFVGNIWKIKPIFLSGLKFSQSYILKLGVILLGIRLSFEELFKFGSVAIPLVLVCICAVLLFVKLIIKKLNISPNMAYLIAIGTGVCGATAIVATAPVIKAKKTEIAYSIANITLFGVIAMLTYPYFANYFFDGNELKAGLFLGTSIHETAQVAAAGLIYDQQFNSPETLNVATVTKLIRNTCLVFLIPLFAYLHNKGQVNKSDYSILNIFPLFVIGFIGMIFFRNIGDQLFVSAGEISKTWISIISITKMATTLFLTMAMSAIGLSINLSELKNIGVKPFIVGFVVAIAVGIVSILVLENFL